MNNLEIAKHFSLLAQLLEVHGENPFKAKSYEAAAAALESMQCEVAGMTDDEVQQHRGIGQSTCLKIKELLETGKLEALLDLHSRTPAGILELLAIKGLSPKKIATIWSELGVDNPDDLEEACAKNLVAALKGFGAKTQKTIIDQLAFVRESRGYYLWSAAEPLAHALVSQLQQAFPEALFALTGSFRRQLETVQFIEIACTLEQDDLLRGYENMEGATLITTPPNQLLVKLPEHPALKFYFSSKKDFYASLFRSTGSEEFLEAFDAGFIMPDEPTGEAAIFAENGLAFIQPPLREKASILRKALENLLPEIITEKDIRGIIHCHSKHSDGAETIETLARAALEQGYEYLVLSDHSQSAFYARGLKPAQIAAQHREIDELNTQLAPFRIFKSIESDILNDGSLDYTPAVLSTFDLVIASVHSNLGMDAGKATQRILKAVQNPSTSILGHMTGRLLLKRRGYPVDHKTIIDACAQHSVAIEINANPRRLDMDWRWIDYALQQGVLLSINPDTHKLSGFRDVYYGVMVAQKGGVTSAQNLSSFSLPEVEAWVSAQQARRPA